MSNITTRVCRGVQRVTTNPGHSPDRFGDNGATFTSTHDLVEAMRDPRYAVSPSYRREVELKLARSGAAEVTDASAGSGRYQRVSEEQAQEAFQQQVQQIGQSEHDRSMAAKFDASQKS